MPATLASNDVAMPTQVAPPHDSWAGVWERNKSRSLEVLLGVAILSLIMQLVWPDVKTWLGRPAAGDQGAQSVVAGGREVDFLLYLPEGYSWTGKSWPLLLFLHGSGERGTDLEMLKHGGPAARLERGEELPMIVVSPQCPPGESWSTQPLMELVDHLADEYRVDREQIYITGYSMGAFGVWDLLAQAPDRFAAAAPLCGGGNETLAKQMRGTPIWAFHGEQDEVVRLEQSQTMVDAVNAAGGEARLTVYPNTGHGICHQVFEREPLYEWLLRHRRAATSIGEDVKYSEVAN